MHIRGIRDSGATSHCFRPVYCRELPERRMIYEAHSCHRGNICLAKGICRRDNFAVEISLKTYAPVEHWSMSKLIFQFFLPYPPLAAFRISPAHFTLIDLPFDPPLHLSAGHYRPSAQERGATIIVSVIYKRVRGK